MGTGKYYFETSFQTFKRRPRDISIIIAIYGYKKVLFFRLAVRPLQDDPTILLLTVYKYRKVLFLD